MANASNKMLGLSSDQVGLFCRLSMEPPPREAKFGTVKYSWRGLLPSWLTYATCLGSIWSANDPAGPPLITRPQHQAQLCESEEGQPPHLPNTALQCCCCCSVACLSLPCPEWKCGNSRASPTSLDGCCCGCCEGTSTGPWRPTRPTKLEDA